MATVLNPNIILQGRAAPIETPIQTMEDIARLRQTQAQAAMAPLRQQQLAGDVQELQLKNQQTQRDIDEQQKFGQLMTETGGDPDQIDKIAPKVFTNPNMLEKIQNVTSQIRQRNATISDKQHKMAADQAADFAGNLQAIRDAKDPTVKTNLWNALKTKATGLKDESGQPMVAPGVLPDTVPDDSTLSSLQTFVDKNGEYHARQAKIKLESAQEAEKTATSLQKTKQATRDEIANRYQSVASPEQHQDWLNWIKQTHPEIYGEYSGLEYDPENTPDTVESMALTPEQRSNAAYKDRMATVAETRAKYYGGRAGLAARANDPTLKPEERTAAQQALAEYDKSTTGVTANAKLIQQRYLQKRADADQKLHTLTYQQEQEQWALANRYDNLLKTAGGSDTVKDPKTGRDMPIADATVLRDAAKTKAIGLQKQVDEIEKRQGWGKYGVQQAIGAGAAAPTTAVPGGAPTSQTAPQKTFPRARLNEYADKNKWTPQQAEQWLTSNGYTLTGPAQ